MKTAGVTAFLVFLAFVLIGIGTAVAEQSTASLSIPAHHLTSKQVRLLTEAARTAQDHRELALYTVGRTKIVGSILASARCWDVAWSISCAKAYNLTLNASSS